MTDKYILNGHKAEACNDLMTWARWFERADRIVAQDKIGDVKVSTVFLGMDHSFGGSKPLLFETMIFGGTHNEFQERYSTWDEAERGHAGAVEMVKRGVN